jgi:hypothetical protein
MIWDGFDGNQWTLCHEAGWFLCIGPWRIGLDLCHFLAIIQKTKGQSRFTIASQSSQMLLIHPMNDLGWF